MTKKLFLAPFALGAVALMTSQPATAQMGLSTTCAKEPPAPKGHIVARVIASKTLSNGKVQITLDKGEAANVDENDDVHLLTCDGKAVQHDKADVFSTTTSVSYVIARFATDKLVGSYVGVDIGKNDAAPASAGLPAGYSKSTIISNSRQDNTHAEIRFSLGAMDGVMPGDKGWIATDSGAKYTVGTMTADLVVTSVAEKAAAAVVNVPYDSVNKSSRVVFIKKAKSSCSIAKADMTPTNASSFLFLPATVAKDSDGNDAIIKFDDTQRTQYRINAGGGGTFNNILPASKAYLVNNGTVLNAEVKVTSSADRSVSVTATTASPPLKFTHVRIAQSTCK